MYPLSIQKLIEQFSKFPAVGPRTAARFVFYLTKKSKEGVEELISAILNLQKSIKTCSFCFNLFEPSHAVQNKDFSNNKEYNLCEICQNRARDKGILCIVEKETDLFAIEKTKKYKGLYFVLGETISNLKKENIKKLRIKELEERIKQPEKFGIPNCEFKEIIIATNPTTEGEATALYLERVLKLSGIKITRLARGLPVGGELEYADEETLGSALEGRK